MHVTKPLSRHFDPALVRSGDTRGEVAWSQFNEHYHRLQTAPLSELNRGRAYPWYQRAARLTMAWVTRKNDRLVDLAGKARWLWKMPVPRDPDIVFFGAEVGWEAALLQALFGDGGRVTLIDVDDEAYARFQSAPLERVVRAPRGFGARELVVRRRVDDVEYLREDLFALDGAADFDVGVDWGLLEHFEETRKLALMRAMQGFLRDGGLQISAVPRDSWVVRAFYWAFRDELNFGYRELLAPAELEALLARGGYESLMTLSSSTTVATCSRVTPRGSGTS
jgi:hypothetical protein